MVIWRAVGLAGCQDGRKNGDRWAVSGPGL